MEEITLYTIACEMLRETNPYDKEVSAIKCFIDDEEISLLDIVEVKLKSSSHRGGARNYSKSNLSIAYRMISDSMCIYMENFSAPFSYRQKMKEKFHLWLKSIQNVYGLENESIPDDLIVSRSERDTAVVMVKALHSPEGLTKEKLLEILEYKGENDRSIQKNLRKLSPDLYEGTKMGSEYEPFRIAGHPIRVKIAKREGSDRTRYYWTPNTLHPIILQENLLQVETLLKALSLCRYQYKSGISMYIALDIWCQLSEYAKEKIRKRFEFEDRIHQEFIEDLDGYDFPDSQIGAYQTQREMIEQIDATMSDILRDAEKLPNRKYFIKFEDEMGQLQCLCGVHIKRCNQHDYAAINDEGHEYLFREEQLKNIKIESRTLRAND